MEKKLIIKLIAIGTLFSMLIYTNPIYASNAQKKEETVYTKLNSSGEAYETIVSSHLQNSEKRMELEDFTDLLNIENVNGEETYTKDGNKIIWNADGKDIYYQGESNKELPIDCQIVYKLNGETKTPEEILGKSGNVSITINYTNKEKHSIIINGTKQTLYTPFIVLAGTTFNNQDNKNIHITNGKVIDDGSKTIVAGMAMPGMQESLGISKDTIEIPSSITITMDTTNFQTNNILSVVTPQIIEGKLQLFSELDNIYEQISTLQSSSNQLVEGANTLAEGSTVYQEKSQQFNKAMQQLSQGVNNADESYSKINEGVSNLDINSKKLEKGACQIKEGSGLIESTLEIIAEKLIELETGNNKIQSGLTSLEDGLDSILSQLSMTIGEDNTSTINQLQQLVTVNTNTKQNLEQLNKQLNAQIKQIEDKTVVVTLQAQIDSNIQLIGLLDKNIDAQTKTIQTLKTTDTKSLTQLKQGLINMKQGIRNLEVGNEDLGTGIHQITEGIKTVEGKTGELTAGATSLYQGTKALKEGTNSLTKGSNEMKQGLNTLDNSTKQLASANNSLVDGAGTIADGTIALQQGMKIFNEQGIGTIVSYINGNVKDLANRVEKLIELSNEYNNFTLLNNEQMQGEVKFIMIVDSIKQKDEEEKEPIILNTNENIDKKKEENK